jgi:nucleotide-binding universal stress UspA family protein
MYDRILIPTDGSDEARKATEHGVELASALGATIHTLYVIDLPGVPRAPSIRDDEEDMREEYEQYGQKVTGEVCDAAAEAGVECVSATRSGTIHEEIVAYANDEDADVIVMGTEYQGRFGALLGSISEKVVRTSDVPVISIRRGEAESRPH